MYLITNAMELIKQFNIEKQKSKDAKSNNRSTPPSSHLAERARLPMK